MGSRRAYVTNDHVVRDIMKRGQAEYAENIQVLFENNLDISAKLVGGDPYSDIAVLKLTNKNNVDLQPVILADSTEVKSRSNCNSSRESFWARFHYDSWNNISYWKD